MDEEDPVLRRLDTLELKAFDAEDLLDQLNMTVYRQQQQIDNLLQQLALLRERLPEPGAAPGRNLLDELPPHY
ncbi:SlyX family protein [Pseudorhodoferax sp. Leaf267]|uniref:SlyX family protein n=1 Tax=Pseudorhodoferax sp. Leaf267 TaxID=1736316 RepID=UPI00138EE92F|nr:SlyX family protein [Pseudorhodoferax sp. Leaf267]